MCTGLEMALIGLAGTAGSTMLNASAQNKSMNQYNDQVTRQNALQTQQFQDRRKQIEAGKDEQERLFKDIASKQDIEYAKQQQMAKDKQARFQEAVQDSTVKQNDAPEFAQATGDRRQLFRDVSGPKADYGASAAGGTENKVMRLAAEKIGGEQDGTTDKVVGALAKMGAMQDVDQQRTQLFRELGLDLDTMARDAQGSARVASVGTESERQRLGAVSGSMGEAAQAPYFRGEEPVYRPPNTMVGDILGGGSQLLSTYGYMQPKIAAKAKVAAA